MSRFKDLLARFLADNITLEERHELFELIRSGYHSDELGASFMDEVTIRQTAPHSLQPVTEEIFASLGEAHHDLLPENEAPAVTSIKSAAISWWKLAAAAMITLALGVTLYVYHFRNEPAEHEQSSATTINTSRTFSGRQYIHLPDGSTVILNNGSKLHYNDDFGLRSREAWLTGEAYFDIARDASKPFKVHTGKITTTVRGTAFNVKAYAAEDKITVTVKHGEVEVSDRDRLHETLVVDDQLDVNTVTSSFVKIKADTEDALAWKNTFIILDDVDMTEAAKVLAARYHITITISGEQLKQCRITSTFLDSEKLQDVLEVITTAVNANFTVNEDSVVISGKRD